MNASLNSYVVAYRYTVGGTWARYRWGIPKGTAEDIAGELVANDPHVQQVSVYDLETWNYYNPTGDPVWNWEKP